MQDFTSTGAENLEFQKSTPSLGIEMLLWRRRQCGLRIPWATLEETVTLLGVHPGEVGTASPGTNELAGAIELALSFA